MSWRATESGKPMLKADSTLNVLIVAAVLALGVGYYVPKTLSSRQAEVQKTQITTTGSTTTAASTSTSTTPATSSGNTTATPKAAAAKSGWAASAPGRVEPSGGEVRISSQAGGRIAEVLVALNDKVD